MIFQIFDNGDVVNTQTWEVLTLKTPSRHHKQFFFLHTLSPPLPGLPGIPSSPETPCKKKTIFADIKFVVIVVVLVSSAYKEGVLKYKGSKNRAHENFSLFTVPTATIASLSSRFYLSLVLYCFRHGSARSHLVKYFLTFSPLFPRDPREPRRPSVP